MAALEGMTPEALPAASPAPSSADRGTRRRRKTAPSVATPDAWLERRLRVFERALKALETRQEAMARDHAAPSRELEEKLASWAGGAVTAAMPVGAAPSTAAAAQVMPDSSQQRRLPRTRRCRKSRCSP